MKKYLSVMTSHSLFFSLSHRGILELSGEDRFSFLQGLISADIESVTDTRAVWAALLTPQGKVLHDFFIIKYGDTLLLEVERAHMDALRARLLRYKLRAHVRIEICTERAVFGHLAPCQIRVTRSHRPVTSAGFRAYRAWLFSTLVLQKAEHVLSPLPPISHPMERQQKISPRGSANASAADFRTAVAILSPKKAFSSSMVLRN